MIIILISVAAVAGWSVALMQNFKASKAILSVIEQEAIAAALRNHVNSLEELITEMLFDFNDLALGHSFKDIGYDNKKEFFDEMSKKANEIYSLSKEVAA